MIIRKYIGHIVFLAISFAMLLQACAPERKNIFSKTYHNTTARYNAYFIAKEKLNEVNQALIKNQENNFNKFLTIFPLVDSATIQSKESELDDCIKKASLAIQRHKNSDWEDDCYTLIGIVRYYRGEFAHAIETFKYVNKKSEEDDTRHLALIYLMRTFIDNREVNNAIAVSDYLKKEKLHKNNQKLLYLTRAYLYSYQEDYVNMLANLTEAMPLLKKRDQKAKIYFLKGQLEQHLGQDSLAFISYKNCLKSGPDYELSFYAKLNMAQSYDLAKAKDLKKIRKYFTKLLKDGKNKEYKDKIYYEFAEFEIKQNNLDLAIVNFKNSVRASIRNERQKSYSYLRLGEIHYDELKKYELAKAYYDSTVAIMPKDEKAYKAVSERQKVLEDFVKQLHVIHLQDSLVNLAKMDSVSLNKLLDEVIAKKEKEEKEKAKREAAAARRQSSSGSQPFFASAQEENFGSSSGAGELWYFYNNSLLGMGENEFQRKWGNVRLEDDWRRSEKRSSNIEEIDGKDDEQEPLVSENEEKGPPKSAFSKEKYLSTIPFSPEAQKKALEEIEEAYFKLGNIYNFNLLEKENASETFLTLINRFPRSEHKPEALYLLYLINKDLKKNIYEEFKQKILTEFPGSIYAKLILNPNYREESDIIEKQLREIYKKAYSLFQEEDYKEVQRINSEVIVKYPDHSFTSQFRLLNILLIGKTENIEKYQLSLKSFMETDEDTHLKPYAEKLLKASEDYQQALAQKKGTQYVPFFEQGHNVILIYNNDKGMADQISEKINAFILNNFKERKLNTGSLILDSDNSMILISEFKDKKEAETFYRELNAESSPLKEFKEVNFHKFAITKDNFQIFYKSKDIKSYLPFFEQYYN